MTYSTLRYEIDADGVLLLTLNRPDKLNAFTKEMSVELVDAFQHAGADDAVRAIVVTGEGRAFCAGMDLSTDGNVFGLDETQRPTIQDMRERLTDPAIDDGVRDTGGKVTLAIYECPKPVIAAVNGVAVGIGATMTLAMDFRFASEKARFGFVFSKIGVTAEACSTWFLPRIVGMEQAMEWLYRGEIFPAEEAHEKGLVRAITPTDQVVTEARAFALSLVTGGSPVSIALTRRMLLSNSAQPHPRHAHEVDSLAMFYTSQGDGREGVQAFRDKRAPAFKSKVSDLPPFYPWD